MSKNRSYNKYERFIAFYLSKFPYIKKIVKAIYARILYIFNKESTELLSQNSVKSIRIKDHSTFFGYYDKSPINDSGLILVHSTSKDTSISSANVREATISVIHIDSPNESLLSFTTNAFNWQQGSRTQWLTTDKFIFNDYDKLKEKWISRVISISAKKEVDRFDYPVQDAYRDNYFLSLNYKRLHTLRPDYGYHNQGRMSEVEISDVDNDGIWKVGYCEKKSKLIISLRDIISLENKPMFTNALHKVNHVMISPSGKLFVFLHRYFIGGVKYDRLLLSNNNGKRLSVLSDSGMISHYFWINEYSLIAYMRGANSIDGFYIVDIKNNTIKSFFDRQFDAQGDGHPHVFNNFVIVDTYPDKARMQALTKINITTGEATEMGRFFHGFKYSGQSRCDLHPRVSPDGKFLFFDSIFSGKRQLCWMEI